MQTDIQSFIDAGDIFDIAAEESRLLHFNGAQAQIWMWKNRNTVLTIDFSQSNRPGVYVSLNKQYIDDNKHNCADYKERYQTSSMKEWIYSFFQEQENV